MKETILTIILIVMLVCVNQINKVNKNILKLIEVNSPEYLQEIPTDYIGD